jgi:hypothetical protein
MTVKGGGILANLVRTVSGIRRLGVSQNVHSEAGWIVTHNAVAAGSAVEVALPEGCNALLVKHEISGGTPNAWVSLNHKHGAGATPVVAHHAEGSNIKTGNQTTSYVSLFKGLPPVVEVVLNYTGGTHTVRVLPMRV